MIETFKDPKTQKQHTAVAPFIISGAILVLTLIFVAFGKLPYETLGVIVVPIVAWITMASKNKNGG